MTVDPNRARLRASALAYLRNNGDRMFRPKDLANRMGIRGRREFELLHDVLDELVELGSAARLRGGKYAYRKKSSRAEGVLRVRPEGYGFVAVDGEGIECYVSARRMGTALDGDRVEVGLDAPRAGDDRREAEVIRVVERSRKTAVGTFRARGRLGVVQPDDRRLTRDIVVTDAGAAADDDKVVVSIDRFDDPHGAPQGRVLRILGPSSDTSIRVLALAMAMGVDADFPAEALAEADAAPARIAADRLHGREDFRDTAVFTIDPVDAKDFDDAIHVLPLANGRFEVGVHIADVSAFVAPGGALDEAAYSRATSVYLVDRVLPMLPERLSADLCSLRPDEERLTMSCVLELDAEGDVHGYRIGESVIRSKARLTYEQAQALIDRSEDAPGTDPEVVRALDTAAFLAGVLRRRRLDAGAVDFDMPEIRVVLDEAGVVTGLVRKDRMASHKLIEEFMLLANRTVATHAARTHEQSAFVYRVHDRPNREKIGQLLDYVRAFGYRVPSKGGTVTGADLNRLLAECRTRPEAPVIEEAALRAMAKATYSPENIGHFGLAFEHYTHFTSPIRRYPDLMVHRLLKDLAAGRSTPSVEDLKIRTDHCAERERAADEAQRESVKLKQVEYMQQHVGDRFPGVVSGVTRFGVFVEIDSLLVEGLLHVRDLPDDYYEYDEGSYALVGRYSGRRFRLGDPVEIVVASASLETREIDFVLP